MIKNKRIRKLVQGVALLLALAAVVFLLGRESKRPALPRWERQERLLEQVQGGQQEQMGGDVDGELVRMLLEENLSERMFLFSEVTEAVSGKRMIPLREQESGRRVIGYLGVVLREVIGEMNAPGSEVKGLRRINEGSRYFEDRIRERMDGIEGISCEIPQTQEGRVQRSGYPDLRILDERSGEVYYLDPKLMEEGSVGSSLRTFYYEPKRGTSKVLDDATHLLVGIEHDGRDGDWSFSGYRLVDLASLKVRLKPEFQASNRGIYERARFVEVEE